MAKLRLVANGVVQYDTASIAKALVRDIPRSSQLREPATGSDAIRTRRQPQLCFVGAGPWRRSSWSPRVRATGQTRSFPGGRTPKPCTSLQRAGKRERPRADDLTIAVASEGACAPRIRTAHIGRRRDCVVATRRSRFPVAKGACGLIHGTGGGIPCVMFGLSAERALGDRS